MIKRLVSGLAIAILAVSCSPKTSDVDAGQAPIVDMSGDASDDAPNLDVWLEQLEVGSRELYSAREAVVAALNLESGDTIADIGAGTGLYALMFAEEVGAHGRVYAEDIEPLFLELINRRAEDSGLDNITAVLGLEDNVTLPENLVDVVFIADTYHYFEDRETVMKSVLEALKPGGSLVLVDYDLAPGATRPADKAHVRFGKAGVISEIEYVGFVLADEPTVEGLSENYFVRFLKPE